MSGTFGDVELVEEVILESKDDLHQILWLSPRSRLVTPLRYMTYNNYQSGRSIHYEDIDYRCQASRVARLLNTVLPEGFEGAFSDADCFDTRRSAVSQHATFARQGWPAATPTAGQLMMRMVRCAENDCNLEKLRYPRGSQALAPTQKQYLDYDGYEKSSADDLDADMDDMANPEEWVEDEYYRMAADAAASGGHTA